MNFLKRLFAKSTANDKPTTSRIVSRPRTSGGVWVDPETALTDATVWACIQYLTKSVAQLPWHAMQRVDGGSKVADTHPVDWLLNNRPTPSLGAYSWRQGMLGWALRYGNAYAEIQRDGRGVPVALWPIHPSRVKVHVLETGELQYEVQNTSQGGSVMMSAMDIFHLRGFGDGVVGFSVVEYAAESIGWARATQLFGATYFGNGMNPSGFITAPQGMSPEGLEEMRKHLRDLYSGPRGEKTMILDAGADFKKVTSTPDEAQFIETRGHQVTEICRWFGVPPHKVADLSRATFSNIEHQAIEVVVDSVTPWVKAFEQEADYKLFGAMNRVGYFTKMSLQGLLRGDHASRAAFYKAMIEMGAMNINEVRAFEDLNSIGPDGDTHFVSQNVKTLANAIAEPVADAAPSPSDSAVDGPPARQSPPGASAVRKH